MAKLGSLIIGYCFVALGDCLRNRSSITDQISFARLNRDEDP